MNLCFFDHKWEDLVEEYTNKTTDIKGIFSAPQFVISISDLHSDMQLLYTLLVDVARVIRPVDISTKTCESCGFQQNPDPQSRSPDKLLSIQDLLPSCQFEWCARPNTWIVFLGDLVDRKRGEDTLCYECADASMSEYDGEVEQEEASILDFINYVAVLAEQSNRGGKVIKILGNHELMNLDCTTPNLDYVTPRALVDSAVCDEHKTGGDVVAARALAYGRNGWLRKKLMLMSCYAMVQIGPAFFMHGGIHKHLTTHSAFFTPLSVLAKAHPAFLASEPSHSTVSQINTLLWEWLHSSGDAMKNRLTDAESQQKETFLNDPNGIFWDRSLSSEEAKPPTLSEWMQLLHTSIRANIDPENNIVVLGHCIQSNRCNNPNASPTYRFQYVDPTCLQSMHMPWILRGPALLSNHATGSVTSTSSLPRPWCGIQMQKIIKTSTSSSSSATTGQIYMCDCGSSRAFDVAEDVQHEEDPTGGKFQFTCRAPQVLVFDCWNTTTPWRPEVWISKFHLPRRWLQTRSTVDVFRHVY